MPRAVLPSRLTRSDLVEALPEWIWVRLEFFGRLTGNQHLRAPVRLPDAREQLR